MNEQRLSCLVVKMSVTKLRQNSVRKQDSTKLYQSWVQIIFNLILSFLILSYINTNRYLIPIDISMIMKVEFEMTYTNMRSLNIENEKPRLVMFDAGHLLFDISWIQVCRLRSIFAIIWVHSSYYLTGNKRWKATMFVPSKNCCTTTINIRSDEGRCSENYYYWVLFMLKLHIIVSVLINLPLPELVALYLLVCFLIILSCTVQKSLSPHLKPQMVYF